MVLVLVPVRELRSTIRNEKRQEWASIHTGRFEVIARTDEDGRIQVHRSTFDANFEIIEDERPEPGETRDDLILSE